MPRLITHLCLVAAIGLAACRGSQTTNTTPDTPTQPSGPMLREQTSLPIGVALGVGSFEPASSIRYSPQASQLRHLAASEFSSVVAENVMKPEYIHPQEQQYHWNDGDTWCSLPSKITCAFMATPWSGIMPFLAG